MKNTLVIITFYLAFSLPGISQRPVTLIEQDIQFKRGIHPGFNVSIPEVSVNTVQDAWTTSLEKGTKSKIQVDDGELSIFAAMIKEITGTPINVYSKMMDCDTSVQLLVTYELKKDEFITRDGSGAEFNKAREYLLGFAKEQYSFVVRTQLQEEEKKLKALEKEMKKMSSSTKKYEKTIQTNNKVVQSLNEEIAVAQTNLSSLNTELSLQKSQYETMAEGAAKDEKKKFIATMQKKVKDINRDTRNKEKKIAALKKAFEKAQQKTTENITELESMKNKLQQQKDIVAAFTDRLKNIKSM